MKNMKRLIVFPGIFLLLAIAVSAQEPQKLKVFTSILPQKFFVEKIGGDLVDVSVLVGPGMSPHTYEPLPRQMSDLSRSAILFTIGVPFEEVLNNRIVSLCPNLKIVPTDNGIKKRLMLEHEDQYHHEHTADCNHAAGTPDPHIWLDPELAITQGQHIATALKEALPEHAEAIEERFKAFTFSMHTLVEQISAKLEPVKGQKMLVFHPAFGYFADRFGLKQIPIEIAGKEPTPRQLVEMIRMCKRENIHVVFVQQQFPVAAAETVARSINGAVVKINPLSEDYEANLRNLADSVADGLKRK